MPNPVVAVIGGSVVSGGIAAKGAKDAASAQVKGAKESQRIRQEAADAAKKEIIPLFEQAQRDAQLGYGAALDLIGQAVPEQVKSLQQGSMNAQETLIAGMDPFRQATLGLPVDLSGIQAKNVDADTSFLNQQLPVTPPAPENQQRLAQLGQAYKDDPVGAQQFFEQYQANRQRSVDEQIPMQQIMQPKEEKKRPSAGRGAF